MCDIESSDNHAGLGIKTIPVDEAVGTVLAHDITEIRQGEFKGRAFKKGYIVKKEDVCHLQRLGKERLFVLNVSEDEMHEDEAAYALAYAVKGKGVTIQGEPREGKIDLIAERDGLLKVQRDVLLEFNMLGDVMCATLHSNSLVKKGQVVAGTRVIPLVVKRETVNRAVKIAESVRGSNGTDASSMNNPSPPSGEEEKRGFERKGPISAPAGIIEVKELRKPRVGVVITGNEVYYGRIKDAFAPVISRKVEALGGELVGVYYAPDDASFIEKRLGELLDAGSDLLITTGGMSVDPDDVTRFAIRNLGVSEFHYGSAVLPGAMILVSYLERESGNGKKSPSRSRIPILGIPACGMYHKTTVFDLVLPRVLAGEQIGRKELAELGYGGLCLHCKECRYPVCPFGK
jgi:hypothetical protein